VGPVRVAPVSVVLVSLALIAVTACSAAPRPRTDTPEPARSPPATTTPAGRLVSLPLGGEPEGMVADGPTNTLAVATRHPDGVLIMNLSSGTIGPRVALDGAPRHLQLVAPGGPVLAPAEGSDRLYELALPGGQVTGRFAVGRQPHDAAAAAGGTIVVGDELADTVHVIRPGQPEAVLAAPTQPGGVGASLDGSAVFVVGVRARRVEQISADGRIVGTAPCGVGPTHVRAGPGGRFYVADTQGDALLVYRAGPHGPRQVGRIATGGTPYGLAVDATRSLVYVTLTATNQLRSFRITGDRLVPEQTWPTPRQPNDVAVVPATGQVVVAGTADGVVQFIDP